MRIPDQQLRRLTDVQAGAASTAQLMASGADSAWMTRQVTSGRWQRPHRGVVVVYTGPMSWRTREWAAILYAGDGAAISHASAAHHLEFDTRPPRVIDVSIPAGRRVVATEGIRLHRRRAMPVAFGRPRVVARGETVVDLVAMSATVDDAVAWVCAAVRARTRPDEIRRAAGLRPSFRRSALLAELLAEAELGIESPLERRYHRDVERRHRLPDGALQVRQTIADVWIRADRVYPGLGVRVELDGALAHPRGRTDADTWRDNAVVITNGDITLRYRWHHVAATPCGTAAQVAAALRSRGWPGHPRPCSAACPAR